MTYPASRSTPVDVLGVGFGPSNIALAIALEELAGKENGSPTRLFLERQRSYRWHGDTIVNQSELQISFLKDLVSLRNPTSRYTFINYLHVHNRLCDFINLQSFFPCREEFSDYLRWVAAHFADDCVHGEEVVAVEPVANGASIDLLKVVGRDADGTDRIRYTRSLVIGVGGTPAIPPVFSEVAGDPRVFHHARYLQGLKTLPTDRPLRICVIGGGQSAAEAFLNLVESHDNVSAEMIVRSSALRPSDDSPFANEIFDPAETDRMYHRSFSARRKVLTEYWDTNYSVVNPDLLNALYLTLYRQKVGNRLPKHSIRCHREVVSATASPEAVSLVIRDYESGECESQQFDAVILATGYQRDGHRPLLQSLAPYLGGYEVERNYRLIADEALSVPIFLQGFCQESHGLSDTLLSVLPMRSKEIATALVEALNPATVIRRRVPEEQQTRHASTA